MTTETAIPVVVRSAGKSRKGAGKYNWDYLCQVEYPAGSRIRGLYAVADGSPSPSRGDLASELAIETLKDYIQHYRSGQSDGPSEAVNLLKLSFPEVNRALLEHRIAKKEEDEKNYPMYTTLTAGYQIDNTIHIGHAGSGAVYMIAGGKIQRLTEAHAATPPPDEQSESDGAFAPGLLGWKEQGFNATFLSIPVEGSAVLIFCTDGVTTSVSSLTLLETWLETRSPEGMVERVLGRLEGRGAAEDASMVVFQVETQQDVVSKFVGPIRYPAHVVFKKHLLVFTLLVVLSALVLFREAVISRVGARSAPAAIPAGELHGPAAKTAAPDAPPAEPAAREPVLTLTVEPADAAVFVDGRRLRGQSPHLLRLTPEAPAALRVERDGYISLSTTIDRAGLQDNSLRIRLNREEAEYGSIKIHCEGSCDEIQIDGAQVKASFPRSFLHHIRVRPGTHLVKARSGEHTFSEKVKVIPGNAAELRFEFPQAGPVAKAAPIAVRPPRPEPAPPPTRPEPPRPAKSPPRKTEEANRVSHVFFTVKTDVPNCALMVFQGENLVITGMSGQRLDLPPGEYLIEAVKEGYNPVVEKVTLNQRLQIVEMRLR
ncbi:MAG: protein phosphatase 2C domain-containing protein [bacterium]